MQKENNFKVLLVQVNSMMENLIPVNLSLLSACLKEKCFEVGLFDTTWYRTSDLAADEKRVEDLQIRPFNLKEYGIGFKDNDVYEDFRKKVIEFKPILVALSLVEPTFYLGIRLLKKIKDLGVPNIIGGVHAIMDPEGVISFEDVDMVCTGEGERLICRLCEHMQEKKDLNGIEGLWFKKDGKVIKNKMPSELVSLDELPFLDFSIFDKERFYRPMAGKIYKMIPVEMSRGCCYNCAFCCDEALNRAFSGIGKWYRQKSVERIFEEIDFYVKNYQAQYLYFISETFLAMDIKKFRAFAERYKKIKLPFWFNTRPETITEEKIKLLEEIGCNRISIGIEQGNEEFRRKALNRKYTNECVVKAVGIVSKSNIALSLNNIIGFPGENRDLIFDTIKLIRKLSLRRFDSVSCFLFAPYKGTLLRRVCVEKGYIGRETNVTDHSLDYILDNPLISKKELLGILRTFTSYCRLPKEHFSLIRKAEEFTKEGNLSFKKVMEIYSKAYF